MIKAVAFDFSGVIAGFTLRRWFEVHNVNIEIYKDITKRWDVGEIDEVETFGILSKHFGIPHQEVYDTIFKPVILNQEVVKIIKKLKENYKIALFSDNISYIVKRQLEENFLLELFDYIVISSEHKITKAQDEYFLKLLSIVNLKPSEIVFIDDKQELVDRGNRLGITSFLFTDAKKLKKDLEGIKLQV